MNTMRRIVHVETFHIRIPKPQSPHSGLLLPVNAEGYIVDPDNGTIYPADDRTLLIKVTCEDGTVGWGETYGIVAGDAVRLPPTFMPCTPWSQPGMTCPAPSGKLKGPLLPSSLRSQPV